MRLLIHAPYFRPHVGGVEAYVEELTEALWVSGRVEALTVIAPALPGGAALEHDARGTRILRYPGVEPIANFPVPRPSRALARCLATAIDPAPDLVVGNTRFFPASAVALCQARWLRVPYLHIEHGSDYVQLDQRWAAAAARAYDHTLGRTVLLRADRVVAISEAASGFVERLTGRSPEVVYRGLPLQRLASVASAPDAPGLAAGRPVLVYAGRLIDGKGVRDLVEAVGGLAEDVLCVVLGDGPRREDLERQAEARAPGRFAFLGYVSEDHVIAWMKAADIVVNPSYTEGLPTTVLLAAACGTAVVATDVGGTREICPNGEAGLLVPPRNPELLRRALQRLLADPAERERLGDGGRTRAARLFDWPRCAEALLSVSGGAARRPRPAPASPS